MARARILVIDDQAVMRQQLRAVLEPAGYAIEEADGGISGLDALKNRGVFDVVICDYLMPDMDGLTCMTRAYEQNLLRDLPILMLTTEKVGANIKAARQLKIAAWIVKPINPDRVLTGVSLILQTDKKAFDRTAGD